MKKQQIILLSGGIVLVVLLFFFGKTTGPLNTASSESPAPANNSTPVSTAEVLNSAKKGLAPQQSERIAQLENSVVRGNVKDQQIVVYGELAAYWNDSLHNPQIAAYYLGEQAKLENSEKKLNFAARLLLGYLMTEGDPGLQVWLATNAKALYDQSLRINPASDSVQIELGACYIFGNISAMPMEGIQKIKQVVDRDSSNMYAQLMLGLGDIRSGQYDKAIERLQIVAQHEPANLQAIFNLAETYERKNDKTNAIIWYKNAQSIVTVPEVKQEIETKIKSLQ